MKPAWIFAALALTILFGAQSIAEAGTSPVTSCPEVWPKEFAVGHPYLLADPRSGLLLYVESDGRHMAGITRDGKIRWQRNLFADPKIEKMIPPPPTIEGEHELSGDEWKNWVHGYVGRLGIDRIGIEPDCALRFIDHDLPAQFHGHYIRAGSGTHIFWLLDAETGDFQMAEVN